MLAPLPHLPFTLMAVHFDERNLIIIRLTDSSVFLYGISFIHEKIQINSFEIN